MNVVRKGLCFTLLSVFLPVAQGSDVVCDTPGQCQVPGSVADTSGTLRVLLPVGKSTLKQRKPSPRLSTLDGKRIAIVGGSFMANVTHPELKKLILQKYPTAKVWLLSEIGSAGPWPAPGVRRPQKEAFAARLRELKIDAVISGNGGCGLCTPKEMGSCIASEYENIPSVMIAAPGFAEQARFAAATAGVPHIPVAVYPGAFTSHSRETLLKNTREILFPRILAALTGTLKKEKEISQGGAEGFFTGSHREINDFFASQMMSDGLPIVPPTPERVAEFLKFTDLAPETSLGVIPPARREATVRTVAVNGVMAGCPPEFMPLLIAFARAMQNGDFRRTLASTHGWTPYCWLNGPVARQLGFEAGQGGISAQRNAQLGRFINLAMLNLGGYYIRKNRMGTFGYLMPWTLVEDEKTAIECGWLPWNMQMGYALNENTLTACSALNWGNNLAPASVSPRKIMELMAQDIVEKQQFALGSGTPFVYRTILITPQVARVLKEEYKSKLLLEDALTAAARTPLLSRTYANYYANPGSRFNTENYSLDRHAYRISRQEQGRITAVPPWLAWTEIKKLETVPVMKPGKTAILISGDPDRNKVMCLPGGGSAVVKIVLPRNWDKLMAERGYAPLKSFCLESTLQPARTIRKYSDYRTERGRRRKD